MARASGKLNQLEVTNRRRGLTGGGTKRGDRVKPPVPTMAVQRAVEEQRNGDPAAAGDTAPAQSAPDAALIRLISGKCISVAIAAAAKLCVADLLANGPKSLDNLATDTGTYARALSDPADPGGVRRLRPRGPRAFRPDADGRRFPETQKSAALGCRNFATANRSVT
jgi:hypothetical protein